MQVFGYRKEWGTNCNHFPPFRLQLFFALLKISEFTTPKPIVDWLSDLPPASQPADRATVYRFPSIENCIAQSLDKSKYTKTKKKASFPCRVRTSMYKKNILLFLLLSLFCHTGEQESKFRNNYLFFLRNYFFSGLHGSACLPSCQAQCSQVWWNCSLPALLMPRWREKAVL